MSGTRRAFLGYLATATTALALASCDVARTSPPTSKRIPRVGYIDAPPSSELMQRLLDGFRAGLREHGYVEGQTIQLELRFSDGRSPAEWYGSATELASMPVDLIVAGGGPAIGGAMAATKTIPIVGLVDEAAVPGHVESLARPGGNVTGIAFALEIGAGKRLELLHELASSARLVAIVSDGSAMTAAARGALRDTAQTLGLDTVGVEVQRDPASLPFALARATQRGAEALVVAAVGPYWVTDQRREIAAYALERHIPLAGPDASWAEAGGLVAFGVDQPAIYRRLAYFVDRILKDAKPSDLPLEQPSTYETVINLRTAKALGVTIPQSVMSRATRVIE